MPFYLIRLVAVSVERRLVSRSRGQEVIVGKAKAETLPETVIIFDWDRRRLDLQPKKIASIWSGSRHEGWKPSKARHSLNGDFALFPICISRQVLRARYPLRS